jgi:hypothetical protein
MKRALYFTACGMIAVALAGCSRGWPNLFCLNPCQPQGYEECDPCTTGYAPSGMGGEWIIAPGNSVDPLPGPAISRRADG